MRTALALAICLSISTGASADNPTSSPKFIYPLIKDHGGIVVVPDSVEPPQKGGKVVIDVTGEGRTARGVLKGLNAAALISNQYAEAGVGPQNGMKMVVILHGAATKAALKDEAYARHALPDKNPDLDLIRQLHKAGVEVMVCSQALAHHKYASDGVAPEVKIAVSAATVNINRQTAGYAYIPFN